MLRLFRPTRVGQVQPLTTMEPNCFPNLLEELKTLNQVSFEESLTVISDCRKNLPRLSSTQLVAVLERLSFLKSRERAIGLIGDTFQTILESEKYHEFSPTDCVQLVAVCGKLKVYDSDVFRRLETQLNVSSIDELMLLIRSLNRIDEYTFFQRNISEFVACNSAVILHSDLGRVVVPLLEYAVKVSAVDMILLCLKTFHEKVNSIRKEKDLLYNRTSVSSGDVYRIVTLLGQFFRQCELSQDVAFSLPKAADQDIVFCCKSIVSYELRNWDFGRLLKFYFALAKLNVFDDFFVRRRLVPAIAHTFETKPVKEEKDKELIRVMIKQLPFRNQMIEDLETLVGDSN